MNAVTRRVTAHPVAAFFIGAYAFTWAIWFPVMYAYDQGMVGVNAPVVVLFYLGGFGPLVSAAVVTHLSGGSLKRWFAQVLRWRVAPRWWLAAVGLPIVLYAIMAVFHLLLGGQLDWGEVNPLASIPFVYLSIFFIGGGNEELGWRGFALPYLQERYSALSASLLIGVVWTVWHAPSGIVELGVRGWAMDLPIYAIIVIGISIVTTVLYNNTGGSVLITMVFHAGVNGAQALYPVSGMFTPTGELARFGAWAVLVIVLIGWFGWRTLSNRAVPGSQQAGARRPAGLSAVGPEPVAGDD